MQNVKIQWKRLHLPISQLTILQSKSVQRTEQLSEFTTETAVSDNEDNPPDLEKEHNQIYKMIKTTKIIRYVFSSWRNEQEDLISGFQSYKERYEHTTADLEMERTKYEPYRQQIYEAERRLKEDTDMQDIWDTVAPVTEHTDVLPDQSVPPSASVDQQYDICQDLGLPASTCSVEEIHKTCELQDH